MQTLSQKWIKKKHIPTLSEKDTDNTKKKSKQSKQLLKNIKKQSPEADPNTKTKATTTIHFTNLAT